MATYESWASDSARWLGSEQTIEQVPRYRKSAHIPP